jgi:1-acyl-sn-glycerol-3-phosphate acyltransferase
VVSIPAYVTLLVVAVASLPLALPLAAAVDLARQTPWGAARSIVFFIWYLLCEVVGIAASFGVWLLGRLVPGTSREWYLRWHFSLQCWWARMLLRGAESIFRMHFEAEGNDDIGPGPVLVFMRHASVGDTVIPAVFLSDRHGLRLRYVMKRELLWDPCLDIVGNRLPNYFVDRGTDDGTQEVAEIAELAAGMGPGEGVLIYPEGTRFTEERRSRVVERLRRGGHRVLAERVQSFQHVLPPKLGGALGLLERRPDADIVFCAHVGFEDAARFSEFIAGGLVGASVRVAFWRIPAGDVPSDHAARTGWFLDQWMRVDQWVGSHRSEVAAAGRVVTTRLDPARDGNAYGRMGEMR